MIRRFVIALCVLLAGVLGGCATMGPQDRINDAGLDYPDIVTLLGDNRPPSDVVAMIRSRGIKRAPVAADIEALRKAGATQEVVDAVLIAAWQPPALADPGPGVAYAPGWYNTWPYYGAPYYGAPYYGPGIGFGLGYYSSRPGWHGGYGGYGGGWRGPSVRPPIARPPGLAPRGWGGGVRGRR